MPDQTDSLEQPYFGTLVPSVATDSVAESPADQNARLKEEIARLKARLAGAQGHFGALSNLDEARKTVMGEESGNA